MKIDSILVVLDKPKHKQTALQAAIKLQQSSGAQLDVVAFRYNSLYDQHHALNALQRKELKRELVLQSKTWMAELVAGAASKDKINCRTIWSNDLSAWLAAEVKARGVDLVIKSIHAQKTLLYTPTDWRILRTLDVPVLLKSSQRKKSSNVVLAAIDFSRSDARRRRLNDKVMQAAVAMAKQTGGVVHVIFALEISRVLRDLDIVDSRVSKQKIMAKITPEVERTLAEYAIPKARRHFPVGKAGRVINSVAHKLNADLLVVGTGTRRLRQAVGLGSTVERVLTKAHRDVLTVHLD